MGVRCTLFGHTYGDSEIEREREESGDEAVVTIREVQECERCGSRTIVSENKEVTSVAGAQGSAPASEPEPAEPADVPPVDERAKDPETDDGVILDDDDGPEEPARRQYGEWPDAEDRESPDARRSRPAGEPAPWPDAEGEDRGVDASAPEADAGDAPGLAEAERPEAGDAAAEGDAAEFVDDGETRRTGPAATPDDRSRGGETGMQRAGEAPKPAEPGTAPDELRCPACGYSDASPDGSLREGDVCPECKQGYLAASE